jgi:hypothetical protein
VSAAFPLLRSIIRSTSAPWLDIVFDLAAGNRAPEAALDIAEPGWRERYRSDWDVAMAKDGQPYIRSKKIR